MHFLVNVKDIFTSILPGPRSDELARIITCKWHSDLDEVVLEIAEKDKRATTDAAPSTLRELFSEMEESGHVDFTVNSHDLKKPPAMKSSDGNSS